MNLCMCCSIYPSYSSFLLLTTMTLPSSYSSSKQNDSPPHQQRRKQLKWRMCSSACATKWQPPWCTQNICSVLHGSLPGSSQGVKLQSIATTHILVRTSPSSKHGQPGAKLSPSHGTAIPGCGAANLEPFFFWFGEKRTEENHQLQTVDANCKTHQDPWKSSKS